MGGVQQNVPAQHTQNLGMKSKMKSKMKSNMKPSMKFSAGEINKYVYCPHQWYYQRIHGATELRALRRELYPKSTELNSQTARNFKRGRDFHDSYQRRETARRLLGRILAAAAIVLIVLAAFFLLGDGI